MPILTGAIIGAIIGLLVVVFNFFAKEQRFNKVLRSITEPVEYAALYHYASSKRFGKGFKYFDTYGVLYVTGRMLYFKTREGSAVDFTFNLNECTVQPEASWRLLKWFSISTTAGEKYYFSSFKMGAFKNNSDETLKGLAVLQAKKVSG